MLTALRRLASTWLAKLLFVLLILSFAIWGIEDIVRNFGRDGAVARVGGEAIELPEAQMAARREMQRIQRQLGGAMEITPQMSGAIARQSVESLVMDRVQRQEAARLRLAAPEAALRDYVFSIPSFQSVDGRFSRPVFDSFLRNNNLTEPAFLQLLRADLERQQMVGAVRAGASGPETLVRPLLAWERERRVANLVRLPLAAAAEPGAPTPEQLARFHENNPDRFSSPEYRRYSVAVLSPEVLAPEIEVSEADLRAAYEQRRSQFETPERRTIEQAVMLSEEAARAVAEQWRGGTDFAAIEAAARAAGGQAVSLGTTDREGMPLPELADAAFSLAAGGVSDPLQTPFGWHVVKVVSVEAGDDRGFEAVKGQVAAAVKQERALDIAYDRANQVEDVLAGGTPLAEAAQRFGLGFATVTTDSGGRTPDRGAAELPLAGGARDIALRAIFEAQPGEMPRLVEAGQTALFAFTIDEVIPPALRPLAEVEDAVRSGWTRDARRRSQEERAAALLAAVKGGQSLADAARQAGLAVQRTAPFGRGPAQGQPQPLPAELLGPVFSTPLNQATMAETAEGFAVAEVAQVLPFDPDQDQLALGQTRGTVEQAMLADLEQQYLSALRARAEVTYNAEMLGQVTAP
ncbi:SurA N-terminal domain-containing protein [Pseudoroseomonas globiformis]|uniref:Parvulin-like PPIase n=1 Tax=Teichococcus globiformis TaxID=2307229 RepID=A0ABV7FWC4_9PROT